MEENIKKEVIKEDSELINQNPPVQDDRVAEQTKPAMRQIIIETDGNDIRLIKAEVSGSIELKAIFQSLINFMNKDK